MPAVDTKTIKVKNLANGKLISVEPILTAIKYITRIDKEIIKAKISEQINLFKLDSFNFVYVKTPSKIVGIKANKIKGAVKSSTAPSSNSSITIFTIKASNTIPINFSVTLRLDQNLFLNSEAN